MKISLKIVLLALFFILVGFLISSFYYNYQSLIISKVNSNKQPVSLNPINLADSNTIAVVCPIEAKDNPNYGDTSCKNTKYFGPDGINEALMNGGKEHTIYIKNGIYMNPKISVLYQNRYLRIVGEDREKTILFLDQFDNWYEENIFYLRGDSGVTIENMTLRGAPDLLNYGWYSTTGIYQGTDVALTVNNVNFLNLKYGIDTTSESQGLKLFNSIFFGNDSGIEYSEYSKNVPLEIKNSIFAFNKVVGIEIYNSKNETRKRIINNTFYNNRLGLYLMKPRYGDVINNIFSRNALADFQVGSSNDLSLLKYDTDNFKFNYSSNPRSKFCLQETYTNGNYSYLTCDGYIGGPANTTSYSGIGFETEDFTQGLNLKLKPSSALQNLGDPNISDLDGSRSQPGAYGGKSETCYYHYFSGVCNLSFGFPKVDNLPKVDADLPDTIDISRYDINASSKADILDVFDLLKFIFK